MCANYTIAGVKLTLLHVLLLFGFDLFLEQRAATAVNDFIFLLISRELLISCFNDLLTTFHSPEEKSQFHSANVSFSPHGSKEVDYISSSRSLTLFHKIRWL